MLLDSSMTPSVFYEIILPSYLMNYLFFTKRQLATHSKVELTSSNN